MTGHYFPGPQMAQMGGITIVTNEEILFEFLHKQDVGPRGLVACH